MNLKKLFTVVTLLCCLCLNTTLSYGDSYSVVYDGNGATSGAMATSSYTIGENETTKLAPNTYKREYTVTFETDGGKSVQPEICSYKFTGWLQDTFLTEITNNFEANWYNISTVKNINFDLGLITLSTTNGVNNIRVRTADETRERLYSKGIYMPAGNHLIKFGFCSPTGYKNLFDGKWLTIFKCTACGQPQSEYGNDEGRLTSGDQTSAVFLEHYDASENFEDRSFTIFANGGPVYLAINCGNVYDGASYLFKFTGFTLLPNGEETATFTDCDNTSKLVREIGGTIKLKAQWEENSIILPTAKKTGYAFLGWSTAAGKTDNLLAAGAKFTPTADTKLYAVWNKNDVKAGKIEESICSGESYTIGDESFNESGEYIVEVSEDSIVNLTLTVIPVVSTNVDTVIYIGDELEINGEQITKSGIYQMTEQSSLGCDSVIKYHVTVRDTTEKPGVIPNYIVSPDGDGMNDTWIIKNIDAFSVYTIEIYDRYGKRLAKYENEYPGFDGYYQGNKLPGADYWYMISLDETDKVTTGHFILVWE